MVNEAFDPAIPVIAGPFPYLTSVSEPYTGKNGRNEGLSLLSLEMGIIILYLIIQSTLKQIPMSTNSNSN